MAFSPDDKRLAVTVQHVERRSPRALAVHTHLFILDVASPEKDYDQLTLPDNCGVNLRWNLRGDALLVCGALLRLADRATCSTAIPVLQTSSSVLAREFVPYHSWWLDSDHIVRLDGSIIDLSCENVNRWIVERGWQIIETVASKHWMVLRRAEESRHNIPITCRYSVVDITSHEPLRGWPTSKLPCGYDFRIAAGADVMCLMVQQKLQCRSINGDTVVPVPKTLLKYSLDQTADSSARVIAQRWDGYHDPWWTWLFLPLEIFGDDPGGPALPQNAVVVDLRSGKIVSSWKPKLQDSRSPHVDDWPFHLALSGKGDLVAESGNDTLELFQVP